MTSFEIDWKYMEVAKNVCIGDWVTVLYEQHKPRAITTQLNNTILKDCFTSIYPSITFLPVIITEEILEQSKFKILQHLEDGCIAEYKCGLVREDGCQSQIHVQIQLKSRFSINDESIILIYDDDDIKINLPIKYVHNLQHILNLCGLPSNRIIDIGGFTQELINTNIERAYNAYRKNIEYENERIKTIMKETKLQMNAII